MDERGGAETVGHGAVVAGAVGFVIACFVPYYAADGGSSLSLWELYTIEPSAAVTTASILTLFTGPVVLIAVSLVGLLRPRPWSAAASISVSIAWSLPWIGILVNSAIGSNTDAAVGYWLMLVCVVGVLIGSATVLLSTRGPRTSDEAPTVRPRPGSPGID